MRRLHSLAVVAALAGFGAVAAAAPATYDVTIDTSSISGTAGSLDFNFDPGAQVTQAATLQIVDFSGGTLGQACPCALGSVTGTLPATLTFANTQALNDYFDQFVFGHSLSFSVNLSGPALSAPDGTFQSGSSFAFSLFSDAAGTTPVLTTDSVNGFAIRIDVGLDGSTTLTNSSVEAVVSTSAVPEPGMGALTAIGLAVLLSASALRRRGDIQWRTTSR